MLCGEAGVNPALCRNGNSLFEDKSEYHIPSQRVPVLGTKRMLAYQFGERGREREGAPPTKSEPIPPIPFSETPGPRKPQRRPASPENIPLYPPNIPFPRYEQELSQEDAYARFQRLSPSHHLQLLDAYSLVEVDNNLDQQIQQHLRENRDDFAQRVYNNDQTLYYLSEFAGLQRVTTVDYTLRDGSLYVGNENFSVQLDRVEEGLATSSHAVEVIDRTRAENDAIRSMVEAFNGVEEGVVVFLSPPYKDKGKGFVNMCTKRGNSIENTLIPYHELGNLESSLGLYKNLGGNDDITHGNDLLRSPIMVQGGSLEEIHDRVRVLLNVTQEEQLHTEQFMEAVHTELHTTLEEYYDSLANDTKTGIVSDRTKQLIVWLRAEGMRISARIRNDLGLTLPEYAGDMGIVQTPVYSNGDEVFGSVPVVDVYSADTLSYTSVRGVTGDCASLGMGLSDNPSFGYGAMGLQAGYAYDRYGRLDPRIMRDLRLHPDWQPENDMFHSSYFCAGGYCHVGGAKDPYELLVIKDIMTTEEKVDLLTKKIAYADRRLNPNAYFYLRIPEPLVNGYCTCGCGQDLSCGKREQKVVWEKQLKELREQKRLETEEKAA